MGKEQEISYLDNVKSKISKEIKLLNDNLKTQKGDIISQKRYLWENLNEMESGEIASEKQRIEFVISTGAEKIKRLDTLQKLCLSPYFGRFDFSNDGDKDKYYIGLSSFVPGGSMNYLVYDWRAPVSSMFYDYDVGQAKYTAPAGVITGEITLKRQYKIKDGEMQYMFDSSLKIDDEILQQELGGNASTKMKNIVATIQREQNKIIRNEENNTLIVQGVAGSGKTSIALHRVAFLLYKHKETIKSNNVLIISPNTVFNDYISSVLPELGEENIVEMSFEDLAAKELKNIAKYENRYSNLEKALSNPVVESDHTETNINKSSFEFLQYLKEFVSSNQIFMAREVKFLGYKITEEFINDLYYKRFGSRVIFARIASITEVIINKIEVDLKVRLNKVMKGHIQEGIRRMFKSTDIIDIYFDFLHWLDSDKKVSVAINRDNGFLLYEDIYPIILLKHMVYGTPDFKFVKHLIVDEMQDYSPVQYEIINRIFTCPKTILGDIMQTIDPANTFSLKNLRLMFGKNAQFIRLNKSYRSTIEITEFAKSIIDDNTIEPVVRHGDKPEIKRMEGFAEICRSVIKDIDDYFTRGYTSIAVLCKTMREARKVFKELKKQMDIKLLTPDSESFELGAVVTTSYLAKGLEFDCVIVPQADSTNYFSPIDRQSLFVACTRALHQLKLYYSGDKCEFIK